MTQEAEWVFEFNSYEEWTRRGLDNHDKEWHSIQFDKDKTPHLFTLDEALGHLSQHHIRVPGFDYRIRNVYTEEIIPMEIFV